MAEQIPKSLRDKLRDDLDLNQSIVDHIEKAIDWHKLILEGIADRAVWGNPSFTKEGGRVALEVAMERLDKRSKYYKELKNSLDYWNANYDTIKRYVFNGEELTIGPRR